MTRHLCLAALALTLGCDQPTAPPPPAAPIPLSTEAGAKPEVGTLTGTVVERLPAGGYLYLLIEKAEGDGAGDADDGGMRWVAVNKRPVAVGDTVEIITLATREGFYSKRLERRFERLTFGILS